jgi:hypothetical protein
MSSTITRFTITSERGSWSDSECRRRLARVYDFIMSLPASDAAARDASEPESEDRPTTDSAPKNGPRIEE